MEKETVTLRSFLQSKLTITSRLPKIAQIFIRIVIGGLFIYAGINKVVSVEAFTADVARYELLPSPAVLPVAVYLPFLEVITGLALLTGLFYAGGLLLAISMLSTFSFGLITAIWRGLDITCGCFGRGMGDLSPEWAIVRNSVLLGLCLILVYFLIKQSNNTVISPIQK